MTSTDERVTGFAEIDPGSEHLTIPNGELEEVRAGELLTIAGSHELRAALMLGTEVDRPYTPAAINHLVHDMQDTGDGFGWDLRNGHTAFTMAKNGMGRAGLAVLGEEGGKPTITKIDTETGDTLRAEAIAGWSLTYAKEFPGSLIGLFGYPRRDASGGAPSSPAIRLGILQHYLMNPGVSFAEAASAAGGTPKDAKRHMLALEAAGFLNPTIVSDYVAHAQLIFDPAELHSHQYAEGTIREGIRALLVRQGPDATYASIEKVLRFHPRLRDIEERDRIRKIKATLANMIGDGLPVSRKKRGEVDISTAVVPDDRRYMAAEMVFFFEQIRLGDQEVMANFRAAGKGMIEDPATMRVLFSSARNTTAHSERLGRDKDSAVLRAVQGGTKTARDIRDVLAGDGMTYGIDVIQQSLTRLIDDGRLRREQGPYKAFEYSATEDA